jgi:hypothetical protein
MIASNVVEGIRLNKLDLAKFIADDVPRFDASHPDPIEQVRIPASPGRTTGKPEGN